MAWRRRGWILALAALCLSAPPALAQSVPPCTLAPVFETLHDAAPAEVGECRGNPVALDGGENLQATNKGLLDARPADNWTGLIGRSMTLIQGPDGLVRRANVDRFDWELNGLTDDTGMFTDPGSGLLPGSLFGPGFETTDSNTTDVTATVTFERLGVPDRFHGTRTVIQTVQVMPTPDLAHALFTDLANLQQGDMVLKTIVLGDETRVVAWRPDDTSSYFAQFRQLAIRVRRSNAVISLVLVPCTRVDQGVQFASMVLGRLR